MSESSLLHDVAEAFHEATDQSALRSLLDQVEAAWDTIPLRSPTPENAETCRLAMLVAAQLQETAKARIWHARALTRFVQVGWAEGVASLLIGEALFELARANDWYPEGMYLDVVRPSGAALAIIQEMEPFTSEPGSGISTGYASPTPAIIARQMHEKLGFLLLVAHDFDASRASYMNAVDAAGSSVRGRLKSQLGLALVDYLQEGSERAILGAAPTERLVAEAEKLGMPDLVIAGRHNVDEMARGGLHLLPYEIL